MSDSPREKVAIVAEVKSVSPLASGETTKRKRWGVQLRVMDILQGTPPVKIGDAVAVQVHSVVLTFGNEASTLVGRHYRIRYDGLFSKDYDGDITVESPQCGKSERRRKGVRG